MKKIHNYIDGNLKESSSNNYSSVFDPSKGEEIAKVNLSNLNDLNETIDSSKKAFLEWSNQLKEIKNYC